MSKALQLQNLPDSDWTVVSGPRSGERVHLSSDQFSIGRSQECEISIPHDPKISRKHARVYWTGDEFRIQSLVDQNPVLIDGRPISDGSVNSGTIIQLGETKIRFEGKAEAGDLQLAPMPMGMPMAAPGGGGIGLPPEMHRAAHSKGSRKRKKPKASGSKRIWIYGILAAVLWFLLSPSSNKKVNPFEIRNEKQIEADIQATNKLKSMAEKTRRNLLNPTLVERQSQEQYVKGFRDFRKGQYERSIESFQACLALSPSHPLCNRYLSLSRKKFGELVQYHMVSGRKYRDQNQYRACRSSFRNVMVMVKDPSSPVYNEAKSNYEACNSLVEGRF